MPLIKIGKKWQALFFLTLLSSSAVWAGNKTHVIIAGGIVHLRGQVTAGACAVSPESQNEIVVMGQVRSNQFSGVGTWADPVAFNLQLVDCSTAVSQQVGMVFSGVTDGKDPYVFSAGYGSEAAQGVGIGIFDSGGTLIIPNTQPRYFTTLTKGTVTVPLTAKYRATSLMVAPGDASAVVDFSLYYP
ncbi:fimbrial protein [Klebsiella aerogenes]